MPKVLVGCL